MGVKRPNKSDETGVQRLEREWARKIDFDDLSTGVDGNIDELAKCDITVNTIAERDSIPSKFLTIGKQVHVLNNGSNLQQTYYWNGTGFSNSLLDFVDFRTDITVIPQEGRIGWDSDAQTLTVGLANGVVLQVGQEMYIRAKNVSGSPILNGQAVYIVGASGNRIEVSKAIASNVNANATIAICTETSIGNNENGFFTTNGVVNDLNTSAIGVSPQEGQPLYLSATTAGAITNVKPSKPNYCVCIGYIVRVSATVGQIIVKIDGTPKLGELSDVDTTGLLNGDHIYYDSATQVWKRIEAGFNAISRWEDIILPIASLGTGASAPDAVTFLGSTRVTAFDGTATTEQLYGELEIPHCYKEGTDLRPHLHCTPLANATGNVKWNFEYTVASKDSVFSAPVTLTNIVDCTNKLNTHLASEFQVISGVGRKVGDIILFRLYRNPSDVQDTFAQDVGLTSLGIHIEIDGDGSRNTFTK